uniref:Uncharacterized protein n=1 Tax=Trichobilharzia regenti TaxID=157069 RepID=A0AA85JA82_TRIRE|nr:unnamed protein product [Trichobilharzia regenti]
MYYSALLLITALLFEVYQSSPINYPSYIDDNAHYIALASPKVNKQIYKESEYVTHLKQNTTFEIDPNDENIDYGSSGTNVYYYTSNNHNNDKDSQQYFESGYMDEESSKYHKEFRKQQVYSQQFEHIPQGRVNQYSNRGTVYNLYDQGDMSDYYSRGEDSNVDLYSTFEEYTSDYSPNNDMHFDSYSYDADIDNFYNEQLQTAFNKNKYYNDFNHNNHDIHYSARPKNVRNKHDKRNTFGRITSLHHDGYDQTGNGRNQLQMDVKRKYSNNFYINRYNGY